VYVPLKVLEKELKEFMQNFRKIGFRGSAVTVPHKESIIGCVDNLDETAEKIGATNTLVNNSGIITGYNTDYYGAVEALKEKTTLENKKCLVIGAGGAARAVVYGLKKENASITIVNRTFEKAKSLALEFDINCENIDNSRELIHKNEIIINTTNVGMNPNPNNSIINEEDLIPGKLVMDIVYNPIETKLIKFARNKGCKVITGDRMLIHQAIGQFELWTGIKPNFKDMEVALKKHLGD
jgi:shikimate dehydrogenase